MKTCITLALILLLSLIPAPAPAQAATTETQAPLIPSITIRPPEIFEDDDLTITFTNVYDATGAAHITMQSQVTFTLAPNGSISFNRDIELITAEGESITLPAGQVFYMYGHSSVSFYYGTFPNCPTAHPAFYEAYVTYGILPEGRRHAIGFSVVSATHRVPFIYDGDFPAFCGVCYGSCRVSGHAISDDDAPPAGVAHSDAPPDDAPPQAAPGDTAVRVLRFVIGSTIFTDNGQNRTLEAAPFIAYDRTMVPLRVIGEALGATNLNLTDGVVSLILNGEPVTMTIGQPLPSNMGTPVIVADRTFVPLIYIINELGAVARWDGTAGAAYIYIV